MKTTTTTVLGLALGAMLACQRAPSTKSSTAPMAEAVQETPLTAVSCPPNNPIRIDPSNPLNLGDTCVSKSAVNNGVTWQSTVTNGKLTVTWTDIRPVGSPYPYSLAGCSGYTTLCSPGALATTAAEGSTAYYTARLEGNPTRDFNGRIIIQK